MTTTYDPSDPGYLDEADVRGELARVHDVCNGCRRCVDLCVTFPTLFELIGRHGDHDAGLLTPAEQDRVVDTCFQCTRCVHDCPYGPELHEWNVDVPRLMLRAVAMQHAGAMSSVRDRAVRQLTGRRDLIGAIATGTGPIGRTIANAVPGSTVRRIVATATGVSAVRVLAPYARQRFSTWFAKRPMTELPRRQGRVTVYPTCLVEYQAPEIGVALVEVYERNGIACETTETGCCGAPWLHAGNVSAFARVARKNVESLAAAVRAGTDIVVPQPTCSLTIRRDYPTHVGSADARLVADHTYDAAEYLVRIHAGDATALDTSFVDAAADEPIAYHLPCHLLAQNIGLPGRDLMELTGATVELVQRCAGVGTTGLRAGNEDISVPFAERLGGEIATGGCGVVAGDCHLANTAIIEQTGHTPQHPLQVLARAYGIDTGHLDTARGAE